MYIMKWLIQLICLAALAIISDLYSSGMVGLAQKWVRLDPEWDKSGTFSDQISVHFGWIGKVSK